MQLSIKKILFVFMMHLVIAFGQVERPKASPYTIETTYKKLKKNYPFITPISSKNFENINAFEDIIYQEKHQLKADIYQPKNQTKSSIAIVLVHGGGWISGSKENQKPMAQTLASAGFVTMAINYRLSDAAKYPAPLEDMDDAVNYLRKNRKKHKLDQSKIVILGASAGAQLATLYGVKSKKIAAIINIDGIVSFIHPEAEEGTYASYFFGYTKQDNFELWKEASPLEYVTSKTPPTLFINSSQPRFRAGRDDMMKKLSDYHILNEAYEIKNSPHSFWLMNPWFDETKDYIIYFLTKRFNK
ncbi:MULTISPECIES: alpha/beta hydrolase [unclassified Empedobacter]|uniref:alpha/beta hydrolase n=1 Tax=unclassified Empedobacter TaxID=2643773 RepID=UPI0025C404CF|nr:MULTISPECIES: alpha/beta hydrolase [unclassified Empedobacter]